MAKSLNELDYSDLNTALKTKIKINWVTEGIAQQIWDLFLTSKAKTTVQNDKIDSLAQHLENASEAAKTEFLIKIQYLIDKRFLKANKIGWLKLKDLNNKEPDEKLKFIVNQLVNDIKLNNTQKKELEEHTTKALGDHYQKATDEIVDNQKLQEKIQNLESDNEDLQSEINAMENGFNVAENIALKRKRFVNKYRMIWNKIKRINENEWNSEDNFNRILQNANLVTHSLVWRWFQRVIHRKWNVHENYRKVVNNLKEAIKTANDETKMAIHYIMKQLNIAYNKYIKHDIVDIKERKQNMKDIYNWMAAA